MGEYEDAVQRIRDAGLEDEAETLDRFGTSSLRKKAERTDQLEKENEGLKSENRKLVVAPKKEQALRAAGVDTANLRPGDRRVIAGLEFEGDDPSAEWVADTIADLELPIVAGQQQQGTEAPNAAGVVSAATNAPSGGSASPSGVITPEDAAAWSTEAAVKFMDEHPTAWEALKRGEEVQGVTTS